MRASGEIVAAFTADQVARLTGLTMAQLGYWDRIGFFRPQHAAEKRASPYSRIYSFEDVVGLRTLSVLRREHHVSLPHLRKVADTLSHYTARPWSEVRLKVWNRKVQFDDPETGGTRGVVDGQYVLLPILDVMEDVRKAAADLRHRRAEQIGRIEKHRYVAHSSPVLAGTRVPVATIRRFLEDGFSIDHVLAEYPSLKRADVEAVATFRSNEAA
jgi:uncharacterized protein (DUF433 family)